MGPEIYGNDAEGRKAVAYAAKQWIERFADCVISLSATNDIVELPSSDGTSSEYAPTGVHRLYLVADENATEGNA